MTYPDDVPVLTDGRIRLRALAADDAEALVGLANDPETECRGLGEPFTLEAAQDLINVSGSSWESGSILRVAVAVDDGIGRADFAGLLTLDVAPGEAAELSFGVHPGLRGRRIATDACRLLVEWAFDTRGLRSIFWRAAAGRYASWRVAWANGFVFDGTTRGSLGHNDGPRDEWHASLMPDDTREPKTTWLDPLRIEHVGVVLRAIEPTDETRFLETLNDDDSMLWLGTIAMPRTPEAFRRSMQVQSLSATLGQAVGWAVADPVTDAYLGTINLFGFRSLDYKSAEVGYRTHPDSRGRGVLTSALRAVIAHAFTPVAEGGLGLERLSLGAGVGNLGSQGVARSCGFTETGRDRQCYELDDGRVIDLVRFDLLRSEFNP